MRVSDEDYLATVVDANTNINAVIRAKLNAAVLDMIDNLIDVAKNSKNSQAKTAAARTLLKLASDAGAIELDPVKDFMHSVASDYREKRED
jgi:hypothetical protein